MQSVIEKKPVSSSEIQETFESAHGNNIQNGNVLKSVDTGTQTSCRAYEVLLSLYLVLWQY